MASQNIIFKGTDTPVIFVFNFTDALAVGGLANFTDFVFTIGDETYNLASGKISAETATRFNVSIGDITALAAGSYWPVLIGYSAQFDDGLVLVHKDLGLAEKVIVKTL